IASFRGLRPESLQSQVTKTARKRLSLSGLEVLHGRLHRMAALAPELTLCNCELTAALDYTLRKYKSAELFSDHSGKRFLVAFVRGIFGFYQTYLWCLFGL